MEITTKYRRTINETLIEIAREGEKITLTLTDGDDKSIYYMNNEELEKLSDMISMVVTDRIGR